MWNITFLIYCISQAIYFQEYAFSMMFFFFFEGRFVQKANQQNYFILEIHLLQKYNYQYVTDDFFSSYVELFRVYHAELTKLTVTYVKVDPLETGNCYVIAHMVISLLHTRTAMIREVTFQQLPENLARFKSSITFYYFCIKSAQNFHTERFITYFCRCT